MSESDLLNFTGHLARQTLSGSSRPTSFLDSGLDKRGKSSILSKLTALNLAADTRRLTGCSQVFEFMLAWSTKQPRATLPDVSLSSGGLAPPTW